MARILTLEPAYIKGRTSPWRLFVPAYLSETGKKRELFFETQAQAKTAANALKARTDNFGRTLNQLSPARMAEAAEIYSRLDEEFPGVALIEVYQTFAERQAERTKSVPFATVFDEFLALPKKREERYLKSLDHLREKFSFLAKEFVSDIKGPQLAKVLNKLPPSSRNAQMRVLRAIFNLAIRRHWLAAGRNPVSTLDFAQIDRREVEVFEPAIVEKLLLYALEKELRLLPWFILGFFGGVRPDGDGELSKLEWRDVHFADTMPQVVIRPEVSKTRRRRFVDLSENAVLWIRAYIAKGGSTEGKVLTLARDNLRGRRLVAQEAIGLEKWIHQGMRHTYCSAWLAEHQDVNKLVLQSGHDNVDTMWRAYHRGMQKTDAEKFWGIVPPAELTDKIVAFKSAKKG